MGFYPSKTFIIYINIMIIIKYLILQNMEKRKKKIKTFFRLSFQIKHQLSKV